MSLKWRCLWILAAAVTLGTSGVVGQVLLWRELLALYQGNELTTGIILANWVLAEACGAWVGAKWPPARQRSFRMFAVLTGLFMVALPASMSMARWLRPWLGIATGQPVGPAFTTITSLLLLLPVSFLHGALFPVTGRLCRDYLSFRPGASIGKLYVWESIGTLLGGLLLMAYFLTGGHGFRLVAFLWVANAAILVSGCGTGNFSQKRLWRAVGFLGVAVAAGMVLMSGADRLHAWTQIRQHRPYRVLASVSSPHGNWTVLDSDAQYLFVLDGQPAYLIPVPDRVDVEVFAHIPLLLHGRPERVCVISGGAGGLLDEILKHPTIRHVDYTELDPALLGLFDRFSTELTQRELRSPRVHVHARDGRRYLQEPGPAYDVIWIGVSEPNTLHANRYFTLEFFRTLRHRLAADGIVVIGVPGRMAYAPHDLRLLHASLHETLQGAFKHVRLLPGEGKFLLLASPDVPLSDFSEEDLMRAVVERDLVDAIGMPWHLEQRLHGGWLTWFEEEYRDLPRTPNRDLRPVALFHILSYHQSVHAPRTSALLRGLQRHGWLAVAAGGVLLLTLRILRWRYRAPRKAAWPLLSQIATTGFAGMLFDLLVIFAFQAALGHLHVWIGLLMAAFMAGAASAASISTGWAEHAQRVPGALRLCDLLLCGFALCLPVLLGVAAKLAASFPVGAIACFLAINFVAGSLTGFQFPLAAAWRSRWEEAGRTAGVLQTADLAGGWIAGLAGATLLLPLGGVIGTCAVIVAFKGLIHFPVRAILKTG